MKKKILFVINTMGKAGAETALVELLRRLDLMGEYELYLYAIIPCGELFKAVPGNVHILNKRVYDYPVVSARGRYIILITMVKSFFYQLTGFRLMNYLLKNLKEQKLSCGRVQYDKLLWRLLAEGRPDFKDNYDLSVAYIEGAATYFVAEKVRSVRKAAFVHIDYEMAGYKPYMDRDCYGKIDRIYVVSNGVGEKFGKVYPQYKEKVRLFRNLLNKEEIIKKSESGEGFTDNFDGIRLVTVGRLHYQKGYDIAIEALARLIKDGYKVRWYVIGEGSERANLEELIKKYKVEDSFILLGRKENPYPYVRQADIYVHATRFEGKSIAIEEAQILGKTIAASDCTGNSEQIISGYDGVLFLLNVDDIVRELKYLIDNPNLRKVYENHTKEKELDHTNDLYDMLSILV